MSNQSDWLHIANNHEALREVDKIYKEIAVKLDDRKISPSRITEAAVEIWKAKRSLENNERRSHV